MFGRLITILAFAALGCRSDAAQLDGRPLTLEDIKQVEMLVHMPEGAKPISNYDRFYATKVLDGRQVIWGVFRLYGTVGDTNPGKVHIVDANSMPVIVDGGCLMVSLFYDVREKRITGISCNGLA